MPIESRATRFLVWATITVTTFLAAGCASGGAAGNGGNSGQGNTAPVAPAGLVATAGNAQVALTWSASTAATGYLVKRGTQSGGPYTQVGAPAATNYMDASLTNGTKYFYVLEASNSAGTSANSAEVNATPTAPVTVPAAPTGAVATAGNAQVALTWNASTAATGYIVKRATVTGGPYTQIATPTVTSFTDTGLTNGTKYFYALQASNSAGPAQIQRR